MTECAKSELRRGNWAQLISATVRHSTASGGTVQRRDRRKPAAHCEDKFKVPAEAAKFSTRISEPR